MSSSRPSVGLEDSTQMWASSVTPGKGKGLSLALNLGLQHQQKAPVLKHPPLTRGPEVGPAAITEKVGDSLRIPSRAGKSVALLKPIGQVWRRRPLLWKWRRWCKTSRNTEHQGNMTTNDHGSFPVPDFKEMEICDLFAQSVQFSHSVLSDSLRPHELQHPRPPYQSPTPGVDPKASPLSRWCHPTISSSVVPFSSCPQSFPASGSFQMSQLFASAGQGIGVSDSASVLPMNTQDWSLGWTGWISLHSKWLSRVFSNTTVQKHECFGTELSFIVQLSYPYMTPGKTITLTRRIFVGKVMFLLFNMLSWLAITFLPRSKRLLISWLQSPSAIILEP